ncbi:MAG: tRNA pseudouridine(13) synthase TruD [Woeseiaceae bacterium]|nr:tRNA pseudouridine(13) synthase TruD [Woeseiaceae bacterium]
MSAASVVPPGTVRVFAEPLCAATIRRSPADFQVQELLGFVPDGDGGHDFLHVEKSGHNTQWVAARLAEYAGVSSRDVGYSGLKDRDALTRQWFSVRRPARRTVDWRAFAHEGVRLVECTRHRRKLRIGAHRRNRFVVALRGDRIDELADAIHERVQFFAAHGMPNYFGEQRFGHDGGNLRLAAALFDGAQLRRRQRGFALSAARALIFNAILCTRIERGDWNSLLPGECANLDGSGSIFDVGDVDAALRARCSALDIHPTATLWGCGAPKSGGEAARVELAAVEPHAHFAEGLVDAGVRASTRPLRVRVRDARCDAAENAVVLSFELPKGAYATALLGELVDYRSRSST